MNLYKTIVTECPVYLVPLHDACNRHLTACETWRRGYRDIETFLRRECIVRSACIERRLMYRTVSINVFFFGWVIYYLHAIRYRLESIANVFLSLL